MPSKPIFKEVQVKDLLPNPFRDLDKFPIDPEKVTRLMLSIRETGFWNNIQGRERKGKYQLCYGHHRLEALKRKESGFGMSGSISLLVVDDDDAMMIKKMTNDNMEEYVSQPRMIIESIKAVHDYLLKNKKEVSLLFEKQPLNVRKQIEKQLKENMIGGRVISKFLGEQYTRTLIDGALRELKLFESGALHRKATDLLKDMSKRREFVRLVDIINTQKVSIPKSIQLKIADKCKGDDIGKGDIEDVFIEEGLKKKGWDLKELAKTVRKLEEDGFNARKTGLSEKFLDACARIVPPEGLKDLIDKFPFPVIGKTGCGERTYITFYFKEITEMELVAEYFKWEKKTKTGKVVYETEPDTPKLVKMVKKSKRKG